MADALIATDKTRLPSFLVTLPRPVYHPIRGRGNAKGWLYDQQGNFSLFVTWDVMPDEHLTFEVDGLTLRGTCAPLSSVCELN